MDSDQGKLFIGGISWETSEQELKSYFENYGEVLQTVVMRDKATGRPRGFGFVVFADPSILDRVLEDKHVIDGRTVEAKRALSRDEQQVYKTNNPNPVRNAGSGGNMRTKKIFVGGLPPSLTEDGFRQYFETYGAVTDVVVMYDQSTQRPRGFGFISFDTEEAVDRVLHKTYHDLDGKQVEVKRALPKDANPSGGGAGVSRGGSGGGGGYQGYGSSGVTSNSYEGRGESNRYMQPQATVGGFPSYGSSGFGAPGGYGYGPANNGMGYGGGYAGYGGANPGYGGLAYGNPNVPNAAGYASGPPGAPMSSWATQASSGYGASSGGSGSAATNQSPSGATRYSNQGYGYGGGYGPTDGSYRYPEGYGGGVGGRSSAGVEQQSSGAGYAYGDANGNSGYENAGWKPEASQHAASGVYGAQVNGGHAGYGGAYGSSQSRQAQQQ